MKVPPLAPEVQPSLKLRKSRSSHPSQGTIWLHDRAAIAPAPACNMSTPLSYSPSPYVQHERTEPPPDARRWEPVQSAYNTHSGLSGPVLDLQEIITGQLHPLSIVPTRISQEAITGKGSDAELRNFQARCPRVFFLPHTNTTTLFELEHPSCPDSRNLRQTPSCPPFPSIVYLHRRSLAQLPGPGHR